MFHGSRTHCKQEDYDICWLSRAKFTTSISVLFRAHGVLLQNLYYLLLILLQGKLTRPTEAGAKADAEATKSNDTAAENFMVN